MSYNIQKILVPVNMSETSLNALDTAIAIAKTHDAQVYILNIVEPRYGNTADEADVLSRAMLSNSEDVLHALIGSIQHTQQIGPQLIQKQGCVVECIINTGLSEQADLIVMGTHDASGYRDGFLGSTTYGVMKHAVCPVLSVPPRKKFSCFRKALFPIQPVTGALAKYDVLWHFLCNPSTVDILGLSYRRMERDTHVLGKLVAQIKGMIEEDKVHINTAWGSGNAFAEDILQYAQQHSPD